MVPRRRWPGPEADGHPARLRRLLPGQAQWLPTLAAVKRPAPPLRDLVGLPKVLYVGNYGLEMIRDGQLMVIDEAKAWEEPMSRFVRELGEPTIPGVLYTPKRITMSITYRAAPERERTRAKILEQLERVNAHYGFMLSEGHTIWEVRPPIAFNKGTAIVGLIEEFNFDAAIFLGDDRTDVPELEAIRQLREAGRIEGLAVAVHGEFEVPAVRKAADVFANNVDNVEQLVGYLLKQTPN